MSQLRLTLKKSLIGWPQDQRDTVRGLGLRRLHHTVVREDTPSVRGMVKKVIHLLDIEEVE